MSTPSQLSFLPDDYLARKAERRSNLVCAGLSVIVFAVIGGLFWYGERGLRASEQKHAAIVREYADFAKPIEQMEKLKLRQRTMAHQAELSATLLEKVPRSNLLAEVTNALPSSVSLLDMTLESKRHVIPAKPAVAGDPRPGSAAAVAAAAANADPPTFDVTVKLTGIADTDLEVAQFVNALGRSKILQDVNIINSDEFSPDKEKEKDKTSIKIRKFQLEMLIRPGAEVRQAAEASIPTTKPSVMVTAN